MAQEASLPEMNPQKVRVAFSKPTHATRARMSLPGANVYSSCHVHCTLRMTPPASPVPSFLLMHNLNAGVHRLSFLYSAHSMTLSKEYYRVLKGLINGDLSTHKKQHLMRFMRALAATILRLSSKGLEYWVGNCPQDCIEIHDNPQCT